MVGRRRANWPRKGMNTKACGRDLVSWADMPRMLNGEGKVDI